MATSKTEKSPIGISQPMKNKLIEETFYEILDILRHLGLYRKIPKFFVLYAHDNSASGYKAYQETVKNYISWFKRILSNVDSDRSPHGFGPNHETAHDGASVHIITNQICLLPADWHEDNVRYVLVFYSKVLASYMKYERGLELGGKTFTEAIISAFDPYRETPQSTPHPQWDEICDTVGTLQKKYYNAMGVNFHHVLTEMALVNVRNGRQRVDYTIPILLDDGSPWDADLEWKPDFVGNQDAQIRVTLRLSEAYSTFFKLLRMFEPLVSYHELIDAMESSFKTCTALLDGILSPEAYRTQVQVQIRQALMALKVPWQVPDQKVITIGDIREALNLHSYIHGTSIHRIFGDKLASGLCDIDLGASRRMSRSEVGTNSSVSADAQDAEGSLGKTVSIRGLFDQRLVDGNIIRPRRLLIHGKPGIGKTSLCKRIMYEYSWHPDLLQRFALIVRIPVRRIEASDNLEALLFDEYFRAAHRGRELACMLEDTILDRKSAASGCDNAGIKVLLILDGLDEASPSFNQRKDLLEKLLEHQWLIMTSRLASGIAGTNISFDLLIEANGLSVKSVETYLQGAQLSSKAAVEEIGMFIHFNPSIMDMAKVPVQLDILCSLWDQIKPHGSTLPFEEQTQGAMVPTVSALYEAVVTSLWRKDIPEMRKMDHDELVTKEIVNRVQNASRLERLIQSEIIILETLAFKMMESDRLEFLDDEIARIIEELEDNGQQLALSAEKNIEVLSVLHSDIRSNGRRRSFLHLTIQEFFAARYLVRDRTSERLQHCMKRNKYNSRYEMVWRFACGLLSKSKPKPKDLDMDRFFGLLDAEPRDIFGQHHANLLMACLAECSRLIPAALQRSLHDRLSWCLKQQPRMASSSLFPESVIRAELCHRFEVVTDEHQSVVSITSPQPHTSYRLHSALATRSTLTNGFARFLLQLTRLDRQGETYLGSTHPLVLSSAIILEIKSDEHAGWLLSRVERLPDDVLLYFTKMIRRAFEKEEKPTMYLPEVNWAANILYTQRELPSIVIKELTEWLDVDSLRGIAILQLSSLGYKRALPGEIVDRELERLDGIHNYYWEPFWIFDCRWDREAATKLWAWLQKPNARHMKELHSLELTFVKCLEIQYLLVEWFVQKGDVSIGSANSRSGAEQHEKWLSGLVRRVAGSKTAPQPRKNMASVIQLLSQQDNGPRIVAQRLIQNRIELSSNDIEELREMFHVNQLAVCQALPCRLHLLSEAFGWAIAEIIDREASKISLRVALEILRGQVDIPSSVFHCLANAPLALDDESIGFSDIAMLLLGNSMLDDDIAVHFQTFLQLEPNHNHFALRSADIVLGLGNGPVYLSIRPSTRLDDSTVLILGSSTVETEVRNAVWFLSLRSNLSKSSVLLLREKLVSAAKTGSDLEGFRAQACFALLCIQNELDIDTIRALHNVLGVTGIRQLPNANQELPKYSYQTLWNNRRVAELASNLESFDYREIAEIITDLPDVGLIYIDGADLWFHDANGTLVAHRLKDDNPFRKRFKRAQACVGIPDWAKLR